MSLSGILTDIFPLVQKKTDALDWYRPLKNFIKNTYGTDVANEFETSLHNIQQMRNELRNLQDSSEASRDHLYKYAATLEHVRSHFPINTGASRVTISFGWYDAFSGKKVTQGNIFYEQANALFNAAVISSQLGAAEKRTSSQSIVSAAKYFQAAAGVFEFIKESIIPNIVERITTDISNEALDCLINLMLAHAQQCIYEKASISKISNANCAQIVYAASTLYGDVVSQMTSQALSGMFDKNWIGYATFKAAFYEACANYHLALDLQAKDEIGHTIARLKRVEELLRECKNARISNTLKQQLNEFSEKVKTMKGSAERDNAKVYHDRVPPFAELPALQGRKMAKPTAFGSLAAQGKVVDAFQKLVPVHVMEAASRYKEQLDLKIQGALRVARENRENIKIELQKMGLPGSILATEKKQGLPEEVHAKIKKIADSGGMDRIAELKKELDALSAETKKICDEMIKTLQEEEEDDIQCRNQFNQRWYRLPSAQLTVNLKKQINDYLAKLDQAAKSDLTIDNKIAQNEERLKRFSMSREQLDALMPNQELSTENPLGKSYNDLKRLLGQLDNMFGEEEAIENAIHQFKAQENVSELFMGRQHDIDVAIQEELSKYDEQFLNKLGQLRQEEAKVMQEIVAANTSFIQLKGTNNIIAQREAIIQDIMLGINKYEEILANITEGINFYSRMQDFARKAKMKVDDFVFARKTEKQDIISNLQSQLTGLHISPPGQYQYQQPGQYQQHGQQYQQPGQYQQQGYAPQNQYYQPQYHHQQYPPQ